MQDGVKFSFKPSKDKHAFLLKKASGKTAERAFVPKVHEGKYVTEIGENAFKKCSAIKSITIPESVTRICGGAFSACSSLSEIVYLGTKAEWEKVDRADMFLGGNPPVLTVRCSDGEISAAETARVIGVSTRPVVVGGVEYRYDKSDETYYASTVKDKRITSVKVASEIGGVPVKTIADEAFAKCGSLESIEIPDTVTVIDFCAFEDCVSLGTVKLPAGLKEIGFSAFDGCSGLKAIFIPETVEKIDESAFWGCDELLSVVVPKNVDIVPQSCFECCEKLKTVAVAGATEIGSWAFDGCETLTEISLPACLEYIGELAFLDCSSLSRIAFGGTVKDWERIHKCDDWDAETGEYTVHCSDGVVTKSGEAAIG